MHRKQLFDASRQYSMKFGESMWSDQRRTNTKMWFGLSFISGLWQCVFGCYYIHGCFCWFAVEHHSGLANDAIELNSWWIRAGMWPAGPSALGLALGPLKSPHDIREYNWTHGAHILLFRAHLRASRATTWHGFARCSSDFVQFAIIGEMDYEKCISHTGF